jgi:hypothetical protein
MPIIVIAGQIYSAASQTEIKLADITGETTLNIRQKLSLKTDKNRQPQRNMPFIAKKYCHNFSDIGAGS